jgi:hypothetical protein
MNTNDQRDVVILEEILRGFTRGVAVLSGLGKPRVVDDLMVLCQPGCDFVLRPSALTHDGCEPLPVIRVAKLAVNSDRLEILDPSGREFTVERLNPHKHGSVYRMLDRWRREAAGLTARVH